MALFDLSHAELQRYRPERHELGDFDDFWATTLAETRSRPLDLAIEPVDYGLKIIDTYDVTFSGYGGQRIKGWLNLPHDRANGKLPCVVEYIGYGGGRGYPLNWLIWASAGYAHLIMDTRGQGSVWQQGDTPDLADEGTSPQAPGFMTRGILSPKTYYYRRVFCDGVRAFEAAQSISDIDASRVAITGTSQGGGITVAMAGLLGDAVVAAMPEVPFLCGYRRATEISDAHPYAEISQYLRCHRDQVQQTFDTLSYFDGINFASRASTKALFTVGLMDQICPPSTVYAAYNHWRGQKRILCYEYMQHETGSFQQAEKIRFLDEIVGR